MPLKAIFFDVGNTLLFPDRAVILAPLYQLGIVPTIEKWHAIERQTKKEFDGMLEREGHADHSFWFLFYSHLLDELRVTDHAIRDSLVAATRVSANWGEVRPGTRDILMR